MLLNLGSCLLRHLSAVSLLLSVGGTAGYRFSMQ